MGTTIKFTFCNINLFMYCQFEQHILFAPTVNELN